MALHLNTLIWWCKHLNCKFQKNRNKTGKVKKGKPSYINLSNKHCEQFEEIKQKWCRNTFIFTYFLHWCFYTIISPDSMLSYPCLSHHRLCSHFQITKYVFKTFCFIFSGQLYLYYKNKKVYKEYILKNENRIIHENNVSQHYCIKILTSKILLWML